MSRLGSKPISLPDGVSVQRKGDIREIAVIGHAHLSRRSEWNTK